MSRLIGVAALATFAFVPSLAAASDAADVLAVIHKFTEAGNGADREVFASYCAEDAVITDHAPPYVFRGPKACQDYWDAEGAWVAQHKVSVSDYGTPSQPAFLEVTKDSAYAVFPVTASMVRDGRREVETATWTFVLRQDRTGWRIASAAWATLKFAPASTPGEPSQPAR
jgi:ketosteroid isomerase-like protein